MSDDFTRPAVCAALLLVVCSLAGCASTAPDGESNDTRFKNQDPDVAYVGEDACRECHFEKSSTYSHTGMGRSVYPMAPDEVVEDFADNNEFVDRETPGSCRSDPQ